MKKIIAVASITFAAIPAFAGIMGVLVNTQPGTSVTGKLIYQCTYNVAGRNTTIILERICPPTMDFE